MACVAAVDPTLDVFELRIRHGRLGEGAFNPRQRRGPVAHGRSGHFQELRAHDRPVR